MIDIINGQTKFEESRGSILDKIFENISNCISELAKPIYDLLNKQTTNNVSISTTHNVEQKPNSSPLSDTDVVSDKDGTGVQEAATIVAAAYLNQNNLSMTPQPNEKSSQQVSTATALKADLARQEEAALQSLQDKKKDNETVRRSEEANMSNVTARGINLLPEPQAAGRADDTRASCFETYSKHFAGFDKTRNVEKAKEFYTQYEDYFVFNTKDEDFIKKTKDEILTICEWEAGRNLFADLFSRHPMKLTYTTYHKNHCSPSKKLVQLAPAEQYYYTHINKNNEQELYLQPPWITHVHELIHLYKYDESIYDADKNPTLDPAFHNLEEQIVITGFDTEPTKFHPINENLFHYLSETPFRSSHSGALSPQAGQPFSAMACVKAKALGTLRNLPCDLLNAPEQVDKHTVTPLTRACRQSDIKIADYLIDNNANLKIIDDYGSPLHAIINETWKGEESCALVRRLIEKGVDVNCRDHNNETPFEHAFLMSNVDAMQLLIEAGAKVDDYKCRYPRQEPVLEAVKNKEWDAVRRLIKR